MRIEYQLLLKSPP